MLDEVEQHVIQLFSQYWNGELVYHDLNHTKLVVDRTREIAAHYSLDDNQQFILLSAAWFHDVGQLVGPPAGHEARSVLLMEQFLGKWTIGQDTINKIASCIYATRIPHKPENVLEEIICDADTYNLGTEEFLVTDVKVGAEMQKRMDIDLADWDQKTFIFLLAHYYFTLYCNDRLSTGKQQNIKMVEERIKNG